MIGVGLNKIKGFEMYEISTDWFVYDVRKYILFCFL